MRKLKYIVLLLVFVFISSGCTKEVKEEKAVSTSTPLLLEVTKEGMDNKLYLFGSIHAGEETMYPLPDYVLDAYKESELLAVEFDLIEFQQDSDLQTNSMMKFLNPDGKKVTDYIGEDTYNKAVEILNNVTPYNSIYDYYNPMMWQILIENAVILDSDLFGNFGVDLHLLEKAKDDKKEILELESSEFQYDLLTGFDYDTQVYLLEQSIADYDKAKDDIKKLYELYKKGNQEDLERHLFADDEKQDKIVLEYNDKLITSRNKTMTDGLLKVIKDGKNVFCTVGMAHVIGDGGIADLLEQKGYSVKIVK